MRDTRKDDVDNLREPEEDEYTKEQPAGVKQDKVEEADE